MSNINQIELKHFFDINKICGGNGMDLLEAIYERHSVRSYKDKKIDGEVLNEPQHFISQCNEDSGLSIQLCLNEPKAFTGMMAKFMRFNNANNYIALVGKESDDHQKSVVIMVKDCLESTATWS